jgi:WD40 repeat protein
LGRLDEPLTCIAVSADGNLVAAAAGNLSGTQEGGAEVRIWSISTGEEVFRQTEIKFTVMSVDFSQDGTQLAAALGEGAGGSGGVRTWNVARKRELLSIPQEYAVHRIAISPDGDLVAAAITPSTKEANFIRLWNARTGRESHVLEFLGKPGALAFSPDGRQLVVAAGSSILVWDVESGYGLLMLSGHSNQVRDLAFSPSGNRLASAADDGTIKLWDWERHRRTTPMANRARLDFWTGLGKDKPGGGVYVQALLTLRGDSAGVAGSVSTLTYSNDGHAIVSGSSDGTIRLFDGSPRQP